MFDKFGEFDSFEELNAAADGLLEEGDMKSLKELAKENGIDEGDVKDYIDGYTECLTTVSSAAFGRLYVEEQQVQTKKGEANIAKVLFTMARSLCMDENFCKSIMKKGRRLMDVYEAMREVASKHKVGNVGVACGTDRELFQVIKEYYAGGKETIKTLLENMQSR